VYSHQQAFAQCRGWLNEHLPRAELIAVSSTSEAARRAAAELRSGAICSRIAAETYGLEILQAHIEDAADNVTRFFVIGHHGAEPTGNDKTSVRFAVRDEVGALVSVLESFQKHGLNLSSIQSRPSRVRSWDYVFYVDVGGHADDPPVREALEEAAESCLTVKVLGSYPRA
jgi:chorismate mutase/prephenate dehydratase